MAFIDLQKTQSEANYVGRLLKKFGLPSDLGAAIAALAHTLRDHKHLEQLLTSIDPAERQEVYDSIAPHLRFKAKPLDVYVANAGQRAEREQWPVLDEHGNLQAFRPAADVSSIEKAVAADLASRALTLECAKCTRMETFPAVGMETPADVILKARKAGWIYDYLATPPREICPHCPTSLRPNA